MSFIKKCYNTALCSYLAITFPKHCTAPIQPYQDRIVQTTMKGIKPKSILVIDDFSQNHVSIDLDSKGDVSHGFLVSRIIEDGLQNANVYKKDNLGTLTGLGNVAEPILNEMRNGKRYDAANVSSGVEVGFDDLSEMIGEEVTPVNVESKRRKIKDFLLKNPEQVVRRKLLFFTTKSKEVTPFIDSMDSLSARGTKVYVSAGNEGDNKFNLLSLIDNSISVGALNEKGEKAYYSANNSLVDRWEKGYIPVDKTDYGYQIKFDKSVKDIEESQATGLWHVSSGDLKGTSFSAPRALVEDMK